MFPCTRNETRLIMEDKACGVVRPYPDGACPHRVGSELVFTSKFLPWMGDSDQSVPFAKATIVSVRPGTIGAFRKDDQLAERDGFANGEVWLGHLRQIPGYEDIGDDVSAYHITFRLIEVDKDAGRQKAG